MLSSSRACLQIESTISFRNRLMQPQNLSFRHSTCLSNLPFNIATTFLSFAFDRANICTPCCSPSLDNDHLLLHHGRTQNTFQNIKNLSQLSFTNRLSSSSEWFMSTQIRLTRLCTVTISMTASKEVKARKIQRKSKSRSCNLFIPLHSKVIYEV